MSAVTTIKATITSTTAEALSIITGYTLTSTGLGIRRAGL
jgi:hypothetical protein